MTAGPPERPDVEPIGLHLTRVARTVSRAFDQVLAGAGGSLPIWLVLVSIKSQTHGAQRNLAAAVGIEGPTLTHHLNHMEGAGLVVRSRDPDNRRRHRVELTEAGDRLFFRLLATVRAFDEQVRQGLSEGDLAQLRGLLDRLSANAASERGSSASGYSTTTPWVHNRSRDSLSSAASVTSCSYRGNAPWVTPQWAQVFAR